MKKIITLLIAATLIIAAAMMLNSCSQWADPYRELDKDGNTVSVEFNPGKGTFPGNVTTLVDVFSYDNVNYGGVKLLSPDDKSRGEGNAYVASCQNHIFGGWYVAKTSENGTIEPDLTKPWDFTKNKLDSTYITDAEPSSSKPVLTLCAYWIPYTNFEIYIPDGNGDFKLLDTVKTDVLKLPVWTDKGSLDLKNIPKWEGMTFTGAYLDKELSNKITDETYKIDVEMGDSNPTVALYTTWDEGVWFRISTANQLYRNASPDGCYLIMNDIDFANDSWPSALSENTFVGKFIAEEGKSVKISNVSLFSSTGSEKSGLFGGVGKNASISNITFENVSCEIEGTTKNAQFALFAPAVDENANLENISISGSFTIANDYATTLYSYLNKIDIGIASASGDVEGVTVSEVTVAFTDPDEIPNATVSIEADGTVKITPHA